MFSSRPSRFLECKRDKASGAHWLPCNVTFESGFTREVRCLAEHQPRLVDMPYVSKKLFEEAGGPAKNRIKEKSASETFMYPDDHTTVPITLTIERAEDILQTTFLATLATERRPGVDLLIGEPVLRSLGDVFVGDGYISLNHPKQAKWNIWSMDRLLASCVLILGNDSSEHLQTLRQIEVAVNQTGRFEGWLLKDYEDVWSLDLAQKLQLMAAASAFIVVEDSAVSGHLTEIGLMASTRTPLAFLRQKGKATNWMSDPLSSGDSRRVFEYDLTGDITSLYRATRDACGWATDILQKRATALNQIYPWRAAEIELFKQVFSQSR